MTELHRNRKECFVVAPIGRPDTKSRKRSDQVLRELIRPAVEACGYDAVRGDMIEESGQITEQVFRRLFYDPLVIADLTGSNPNVYYELAICHALRRPLVQLIEKDLPIPFDVADVRTVEFSLESAETIRSARQAIIRRVRKLEKQDSYLETPISMAVDSQLLVTKEPDLEQELKRAKEVWLTGVSLASTVGDHSKALKKNVARGLKVKALVANPYASVIMPAVLRKSDPKSLRAGLKKKETEINHSLSILQSLQTRASGLVRVLMTDYPLAYGAIAIDPGTRHGVVHIRFYPYGVDNKKPALTLRTGAPWYGKVVQELKALWKSGSKPQNTGQRQCRVFLNQLQMFRDSFNGNKVGGDFPLDVLIEKLHAVEVLVRRGSRFSGR